MILFQAQDLALGSGQSAKGSCSVGFRSLEGSPCKGRKEVLLWVSYARLLLNYFIMGKADQLMLDKISSYTNLSRLELGPRGCHL